MNRPEDDLEMLRKTVFETLFSDTDSLEKAIHALLENEQERTSLVALLARFFRRCDTAHEMNSEVSYAHEAESLYQQLDVRLFQQVWKMALNTAIEQGNISR